MRRPTRAGPSARSGSSCRSPPAAAPIRRAAGGAEARRALGPAARRRKPRRRRRQHRQRRGRPRGCRRLHARPREHQHARGGGELRAAVLRSGQGFCPGIDAGPFALRACALSRRARAKRARADRARASQAARAQLRLRGSRNARAPLRRAVREDGEDRAHPRTLSRHRAVDARSARRSRRDAVRHHPADARAHSRGQAARAGGDRRGAQSDATRRADHRRIGPSRLRMLAVAGDRRVQARIVALGSVGAAGAHRVCISAISNLLLRPRSG